MNKNTAVSIGVVVLVLLVGIGAFFFRNSSQTSPSQQVACTMDAKLCPDGSYVGRQGPNCEFAACPAASSTSVTPANASLTLAPGEKGTVDTVTVTFNSVIGDSRCPTDVNCIQAGTVTVSATVSDAAHTETHNLSLGGTPLNFDGHLILVTSVSPDRSSKTTIANADYRVTFLVETEEKG